MIRIKLAIIAAICFFGAWACIESDIRQACGNSQACIAASL